MYLGRTTCEITLAEKYRLKALHEIEIKKSVHQIIQTAKLTLPLNAIMLNNDVPDRIRLADKIKEGDRIVVKLGYDNNNKKEFDGYIRRINPKQPLELELEDQMYLLRKLVLKKSFVKNDVRDILNYLNDELYKKFQVRFKLYDNMPKVTVDNFLINGANGVEVLQELKDKYLLSTYLTEINNETILYCGLVYGLKKKRVKYQVNRNTINIDDLKYNVGEDRTFNVEVVNHLPSGKVIKWEFGDRNGERIKIYVPGNKTEAELKHRAEAEIATYKTNGYKGSFETFMIPHIEPGDIAAMEDLQFPDRSGTYYTATVVTRFGVNGGRRKPEIDIRTQ